MYIAAEYLLAADEYARALKVTRSYRRWILLALACAFAAGGAVSIIRGYPQPGGFFLALVPFYLFAAPLEIKWYRARFERRTNRVPVTAVFTETTFTTRSVLWTVELGWQACFKVVETPESFLIYATKRSVTIVPKRAFSPADLALLSDFLRTAIPATASMPVQS
jgi:hypothetical protein